MRDVKGLSSVSPPLFASLRHLSVQFESFPSIPLPPLFSLFNFSSSSSLSPPTPSVISASLRIYQLAQLSTTMVPHLTNIQISMLHLIHLHEEQTQWRISRSSCPPSFYPSLSSSIFALLNCDSFHQAIYSTAVDGDPIDRHCC